MRRLMLPALLLATVRCGGDDAASLRVIDVIASGVFDAQASGPIDVDLDGENVGSGLVFGTVSDALSVPAGEHTLVVRYSGSTESVATLDFELGRDRHDIIMAQRAGSESADPVLLTLLDDAFEDGDVGDARVRFTSASNDLLETGSYALAFDVGRDGTDALLFDATGTPDLPVSAAGGTEVGVIAQSELELGAFVTPALVAGRNYYAICVGSLFGLTAAQRLNLLFVSADGSEIIRARREPSVSLYNAMYDGTRLQAKIDGGVVANDLAFGELAGPYRGVTGTLVLALAPGVEPVVFDFSDPAQGEEDHVVFFAGSLQERAELVHPEPIVVDPEASTFRAINLSSEASLDFAMVDTNGLETSLGTNVAFATAVPTPGVKPTVLGDVVARRPGEMIALDALDLSSDGVLGQQYLRQLFQGYVIAVGKTGQQGSLQFELELIAPWSIYLGSFD